MRNIFKHSGIFLLLFLTLIVLGTTLMFFIHVGITRFHLIIFLLLTGIVYYFVTKKKIDFKSYLKVIGISLIVIVLSTCISTFMYDRSSDGNTYHKNAVGVLKEGFNPVYESSKAFINDSEIDNYSIWIDHYAKANWIIEANFYSLTNNIESGKAINFISLYSVFIIMFSVLSKFFDSKKSLILSLISVLNPITSAQLLTYYNDQLIYLYLLLGVLMLINLDKDISDKESWFIYILSFILITNTKFNGLGYILVFSFLFVCRYLYKAFKSKEFNKVFKKMCIIFIPLFIVSFLVVGYPTYVKNTIDHSNPFFPLYDENGEDIITLQQPKRFSKMNNVSKLFYATFSKVNNLRDNDKTTLKIPFSVSKDEIIPATSNDLRISGWGLLFSGLLIVSIGVLIVKYKDYKKENYLLYTLGITVLLLLVMSESWWARYTPHFYFFILIGLYILLKYNKKKWFNIMYIILILGNILVPLLGNSYYTLTNSIKINKELRSLKDKKIVLKENNYHGLLYNLKDYDISYEIDNNIEGKELFYHYLEYKDGDIDE